MDLLIGAHEKNIEKFKEIYNKLSCTKTNIDSYSYDERITFNYLCFIATVNTLQEYLDLYSEIQSPFVRIRMFNPYQWYLEIYDDETCGLSYQVN